MSAFLRSPFKINVKADAENNPHQRVVLLLDMDCFYAQCETVRLGLDQTLPLALVQWNSALAVSYPARKFGIKRGDSYEVIQEKSQGKCVAIHLPVTPVDEATAAASLPIMQQKKDENASNNIRKEEEGGPSSSSPCKGDNKTEGEGKTDANDGSTSTQQQSPQRDERSSTNMNDDDDNDKIDSSQSAYDEEFNQPKEIRDEMYKNEKNKMRSPKEGKACLDRYRLASSRIFSLIDETLAQKLGRKNFILERASIDELFIDVTAFCYDQQTAASTDNDDDDGNANGKDKDKGKDTDAAIFFRSNCDSDAVQSLKETVICHQDSIHSMETNDQIGTALTLGCHIARTVRRAVFETLGFTLSAGISTNKLVSKLTATFGKPNGQAVVYPAAMEKVMDETQLRKARMLGGKLGKKVSSLLPENETTMGSIARLLPLNRLEEAIGEESGRWVFDACRGIDHEEVRATLKVLPKSITAFKSFPKVSYPELEKWTALLARDVMKRVENDNARNNRLPKSVTVGYTMQPGGAWIGRTFRLPFPQDKDFNQRVQKLVDSTRRMLTERGHDSFIRIGFSAIDFVVRPKVGIDSFFSKGKSQSSSATRLLTDNGEKKTAHRKKSIDAFFQATINPEAGSPSLPKKASTPKSTPKEARRSVSTQKKVKGVGLMNSQSDDVSAEAKINTSDEVKQSKSTGTTDEEFARRLQDTYNNEAEEGQMPSNWATSNPESATSLPQKASTPKSTPKRTSPTLSSQKKAKGVDPMNRRLDDVAAEAKINTSDEVKRSKSTGTTDEEFARGLQDTYNNEAKEGQTKMSSNINAVEIDKDAALALQLQSTFDREHSVLSHVERFSTKRKHSQSNIKSQKKGSKNKKGKIDYFLKK